MDADLGLGGVATFFAISGFIIWTSSRRESTAEFVQRRLLRIVPMYWLALVIALGVGVRSWGKPMFSPEAVVKSFLFIPYFVGPPIPFPFPILGPGWSLNFEMLFYAVFAVGMLAGRPLLVSSTVMMILFVVGQTCTLTAAPLVLYTKWLTTLFVVGMLVGHLAPAPAAGRYIWPAGFILVLTFNFLPMPKLWLALGITLLIVGITGCERRHGWLRSPALAAMGNASYATYLLHVPILMVLHSVLVRAQIALPWAVYGLLSLTCAWIVGLLVHIRVEKPMSIWLRRKILSPATGYPAGR